MASMQDIISLAKRRGFVYPGSEIYGGLANTYDFGPIGVELLRNIQNYWWQYFVTKRQDIVGLDTSILMSPKVWEASGHTDNFTDSWSQCSACNFRTRADHLIEDHFEKQKKEKKVEGKSDQELTKIIKEEKINCPKCGKHSWVDVRKFNLLFKTNVGVTEDKKSQVYLRGEIAQGMFVNFRNVLDTQRIKLPFGLAQQGKAFRNEITLGNFIFRTLEFNLSEFEYFFDPNQSDWKTLFTSFKKDMHDFALSLGLSEKNLKWREHTQEERSHYSEKTEDLDYKYPGGFKEMFGLAYRTDFDLKNHMEKSGVDLRYIDPKTGKKILPHVIEPTFGINRMFLAILAESYTKEEKRIVLKLPKHIAPYKAAVFPLLANKPELIDKAKEVHDMLSESLAVAWDARGNIGKRYLTQDEIGTPYCITIDFDSLKDDRVTVRDRDTRDQPRVKLSELTSTLKTKLDEK